MKYRDHPVIQALLSQIFQVEREGLLKFIISRHVPESRAEDVLQTTFERVLNLDIRSDLADNLKRLSSPVKKLKQVMNPLPKEQLSVLMSSLATESKKTEKLKKLEPGEQLERFMNSLSEEQLEFSMGYLSKSQWIRLICLLNMLKAITVTWLGRYCKASIKPEKNSVPINENINVADKQASMKQAVQELIIGLTHNIEVDTEAICDWMENINCKKKARQSADFQVITFLKHLAELAKCSEEERQFLLKRATNPDLPDQALFPRESKASISRIKKSLFLKLCDLLDIKIPFFKQRKTRHKGNMVLQFVE